MKLLMHMCCGPCSCYPLKRLREDGIEPTGYFFNPNIHPYMEWDERLQSAEKFAVLSHMDFIADREYRIRDFLKKALPAENMRFGRCHMCYTWRLENAVRYASDHGFDAFTSTLFYSIYQQHEMIRSIAQRYADIYGISFYYKDFRIGWQEGIDISKELGLYRQSYCGCIFSEEERYSRTLRKIQRKENKEKKRRRLMAQA